MTFNDYKPNDKIWIAYDKCEINNEFGCQYTLVEAIVLENKQISIEHTDYSDSYNYETNTNVSNFIKIIVPDLNDKLYSRVYNHTYTDIGHMSISTGIYESGPWITVFDQKERALSFIKEKISQVLERNNKKIEQLTAHNCKLIDTLNNIKQY